MKNKSYQNIQWIALVRAMLRQGYGVEDISVIAGFDVEDVRREVGILRGEGQLSAIYRKP